MNKNKILFQHGTTAFTYLNYNKFNGVSIPVSWYQYWYWLQFCILIDFVQVQVFLKLLISVQIQMSVWESEQHY